MVDLIAKNVLICRVETDSKEVLESQRLLDHIDRLLKDTLDRGFTEISIEIRASK